MMGPARVLAKNQTFVPDWRRDGARRELRGRAGRADEPGGRPEPAAHLLDAPGEHPGLPARRRRRDRHARAPASTRCSAIPRRSPRASPAHDLKAKRPLIPLQIDPPDHRKYRKLLDPLFAPQRMKLLEDSTSAAGQRPDRRLRSDARRDRLLHAFSTPFPSQVFLTLFGLPMDDLPRFLTMKDGAIRPDQVVGHEFGHPETEAYQQQTADSIYAYFEQVIDEPARRRARRPPRATSCTPRSTGTASPTRRSSTSASCSSSPGSTPSRRHSTASSATSPSTPTPGAGSSKQPDAVPSMVEELLRWETPVMGCAASRHPRHRDRRLRDQRGRTGDGAARRRQRRRGRVPGRRRARLGS